VNRRNPGGSITGIQNQNKILNSRRALVRNFPADNMVNILLKNRVFGKDNGMKKEIMGFNKGVYRKGMVVAQGTFFRFL